MTYTIKFDVSMFLSLAKKKPVPNPQDWSLFLDAVSYTNSPIQASLLEFPIVAINKLALECFIGKPQKILERIRVRETKPISQMIKN